MICNEEKCHFFNFNTNYRINLYSRANIECVLKANFKAIEYNFRNCKKNIDKNVFYFIEKKRIHLIYGKCDPFLHNTAVLVFRYEGYRLVGVIKLSLSSM